jgi:hypothetical protein
MGVWLAGISVLPHCSLLIIPCFRPRLHTVHFPPADDEEAASKPAAKVDETEQPSAAGNARNVSSHKYNEQDNNPDRCVSLVGQTLGGLSAVLSLFIELSYLVFILSDINMGPAWDLRHVSRGN